MLDSWIRETTVRTRDAERTRAILRDLTGTGVLTATLFLLAGALRVYTLGDKSIWLDEAFSIHVARQPVGQLLDMVIRHDTPPPLYYLLLHAWMGLGIDPFTVRLLSALLGVGCVAAVWLLGVEVAGRREGMLAALLAAVSPFLVWYGQEARMYSLLAFLCAVSAYLLLRGLKRGGAWVWGGYVVVTGAALYTQLSAMFFFASTVLAALVFMAMSVPGRPLPVSHPQFRPWLLAQAAALLAWLPWLPFSVQQGQTYQRFWIDSPTPGMVSTLIFELSSAYFPHWHLPAGQLLLVAGSLLLVALAFRRLGRGEHVFLLILFAVPVVGIYLVSIAKPIFLSRAVIFVAPPFLLLLACGALSFRRREVVVALIGIMLALNFASLYRVYHDVPKERWDLAAEHLASRATPGELVLFVATDVQLAFDYYADQLDVNLEKRGLPVDVFSVGPLEPMVESRDLARIDELAAGRKSFWVVESHTFFADPDALVRQKADRDYRLVERSEFYGVTLLRYQSPPAPISAEGTAEAR